jgi:transglutaminase-like putative cysteine protease
MGIVTIVGSIFVVASIIWGLYSFALIQYGAVRPYEPHQEYDLVKYWPYTNNWTGGRTNWFDNLNYTDFQLDQPLPQDLLNRLDDVVFVVTPKDPGQLWRQESYDFYNGAGWSKTSPTSTRPLTPAELIPASAATNIIYTVILTAPAGAEVGSIELPSLFPSIRVINGSFKTYTVVDGNPVEDIPSRFLHLELATDDYGTLLLSPLIQGTTGEQVPVSFDITFVNQDIANVVSHALPGSAAPGWTSIYRQLPALTQRVIDNITQFMTVGNNAYEKAMAVKTYFQSTFELNITPAALADYPRGQEVTDWFLERGNGLPQHFATAYAVFMRYLGIPARVVSGYALGDPDPVDDFRSVKIRHMTFWVEVFVPMSGSTEGEWIQVIPTPLPPEFGGGEDPINTPIPTIELLVWPSNGLYYAAIGTPFSLSASITVDGVPITTPDIITFNDVTDSQFIGTATIGQPPDLPIANVTYVFPPGATVSYHILSATWVNSYFSVMNATSVFAVGTPSPALRDTQLEGGFIISETQELNVSQGIDTHVTSWEDTVHVFGIMTVNGVPMNSSLYTNQFIRIMWDNTFVGNASIDEYGYYNLNVYVDPLNFALMNVGSHEVWSWYLGDWDGPILRLTEARSSNNSTITVWGRVELDLSVSPTNTSAGGTVYYDGAIRFLNGSLLPIGQSVGVFFGTQANATIPLNTTGGFQWSYMIPVSQPDGTYFTRANWTNPLNWQYIKGNWSISIPIDVGAGGTKLWVNPLPNPLFIGQEITIWGNLTHVANASGISGQWVDIWWSTGVPINIGPVITAADGYFEVNYTIPAGYEGPVEYWANFTSSEPTLANSELLPHLFSSIKRYDVSISLLVNPNPVHLLQTVRIQGVATLPENASTPLAFVDIDIWWGNSTGDYLLNTIVTNSSGGYVYYYQIPIGHNIELVTVWASYTSLFPNIADGDSLLEPLSIETTSTLITVNEDFTIYHLNDTVLLYGSLQFANGTPLTFEKVYIHWVNASGTWVFEKFTDVGGNYQFQYNFSTSMSVGTIDVYVNWTSWSPLYANATDTLIPSIQVIKYDVQITLIVPTQIYVDEDLVVQGVLAYAGGTPTISGATVYIAYNNGTHWVAVAAPVTNSTGGFQTLPIPFASPDELTYNFAAIYLSSDPLVNDHWEFFDVSRVKYSTSLDLSVPLNPWKQNVTLPIHIYLYYQNNGTPLASAVVSIYWNNGTLFFLGNVTTDGTGQADFYYSGMYYDTVRNNIQVYGYYAGTVLRGEVESTHLLLTLEQWLTEVYNVNTDFPTYRLTETVIVTGNLRYLPSFEPYAGVTVELLLSGVPIDSTVTLSDGSFTLYWTIPQDTPVGTYNLLVRFQSIYPWIADSQAPVPSFDINAPGYIFVSFTVTPASPTEVYILNDLLISGTVTWDNGSFYSNSEISLFWRAPVGTEINFRNVTTNGVGMFTTSYTILEGTLTGSYQVWAYIYPAGYATSGMSAPQTIIIATYSVIITASVNATIVHKGEYITFSGTAQFSNTTPLNGYPIDIWWGGVLLHTATITAGTYSYAYLVPYSQALGVTSGHAQFNAPTAAFVNATEFFADVTVREYIDLYLDSQPSVTIFARGDTVTVTGYVLNDNSGPASGVTVEVLANGIPTVYTSTTGVGGTFSIGVLIPLDQATGLYTLTINSVSPYRDVSSSSSSWTISVYRDSVVDITVMNGAFMPRESFSVTINLHDDQGVPINGVTVHVFLNNTEIAAPFLTDGNGQSFNLTIPAAWSGGSGSFTVRAQYNGGSFTNGHTGNAADSIHIFTDVVFSLHSASRIDPGQTFVIEVELADPAGYAIESRDVILNLNGSQMIHLTTGSDGRISYSSSGYADGTVLYITVTLTSIDAPEKSGQFTIRIQIQGGIILQGTDLIIAGILLVGAVIAVLAYLYIVKGMFRSPVISRGIDIPTKLRNIKKLADAGKYGASITLAYRTFEQMCGSKMGSERTHSETAREYLDRVLQSIPLDAPTVEQFVQTYEEARFSHHEMTRERYEAALRVFTDLYPRIDASAPME